MERIGFGYFCADDPLLPVSDASALRFAMLLHRGPRCRYSGRVIERVGRIEAGRVRPR